MFIGDGARTTRFEFVVQSLKAMLNIPLTPDTDSGSTKTKLPSDCLIRLAVGSHQDDLGSLYQRMRHAAGIGNRFEIAARIIAEHYGLLGATSFHSSSSIR
jgi:hypothetical protein